MERSIAGLLDLYKWREKINLLGLIDFQEGKAYRRSRRMLLMRGMTLKQVAEKFGVAPSTARLWQKQGYFPNAKLEETVLGPVWIVPKSDVSAFKPPIMGRPVGTKKAKPKAKRKAAKRPKV
jgi:uncharacterized protein YjcR